MQPNGMIFWDWNGTLMDDVDFTHGCLNWMLESHGYPQRYDLAQYRELFRFPIEDYYRLAGFDFSRHPYPMLAEHFMAHYNAGVDACPVMAHAVDTRTELARRAGSAGLFYRVARPCGHLRREQGAAWHRLSAPHRHRPGPLRDDRRHPA